MPTKVAIVGVTGYAGGELARLVLRHPEARLVAAVARSHQGEPLRAVQPHLHAAPDSLVVGSDVDDAEVVSRRFRRRGREVARAWLGDGRTVIDIEATSAYAIQGSMTLVRLHAPRARAAEGSGLRSH